MLLGCRNAQSEEKDVVNDNDDDDDDGGGGVSETKAKCMYVYTQMPHFYVYLYGKEKCVRKARDPFGKKQQRERMKEERE